MVAYTTAKGADREKCPDRSPLGLKSVRLGGSLGVRKNEKKGIKDDTQCFNLPKRVVRGPLTHLENSEIRPHWRVRHELVSFFGHGCSELLLKRRQDLQGCCSEEGCGLPSGDMSMA